VCGQIEVVEQQGYQTREIERAFAKAKAEIIRLARLKGQTIANLARQLYKLGVEKQKIAGMIANRVSKEGLASRQWAYKVMPKEFLTKQELEEREKDERRAVVKQSVSAGQVLVHRANDDDDNERPSAKDAESHVQQVARGFPHVTVPDSIAAHLDEMTEIKHKALTEEIDALNAKVQELRKPFTTRSYLSVSDQELPVLVHVNPVSRLADVEWDQSAVKKLRRL